MPAQHVAVTSVLSDQEEYTIDLTTETQLVIPESVYILLNTLNGYYSSVDGRYYLDVNLDGTPDLELTVPAYEEEEDDDEQTGSYPDDDDEEDPLADEYVVKRLAEADQVNENYRFTPYYPAFPYRYNKIVVKLTNSDEVQEQIQIDDLIDNSDNGETLREWNGKKHSLNILGRTLYKDGDWNTLCLPFNLTIAGSILDGPGVEARSLTNASVSNTTLSLTFSNPVETLQSGVPYIIKWDAAENLVSPVFKDVTIDLGEIAEGTGTEEAIAAFLAAKGYDNKAANADERVRFLGTFKDKRFDYVDKSILFLGANDTLYYPAPVLTPTTSIYPEIAAFRAYFKIGNGDALTRQLTAFNLSFGEDNTQGIVEVEDNSHPSPFTSHHSSLTSHPSVWYSLDGRKLDSKPSNRGVYVINGRKVVIK
jgi:hypothetical protein